MLLRVCCQRISWILLTYVLSLTSTADGCRADQFACHDGVDCIRQSYRCDGSPDCDDGSDELDCEQPILDNYLLVSVVRPDTESVHIRPQIYQIDLATNHAKPLLKTDPGTPASLAIDHKKQVLYFVDRSVEMICRVSLTDGNSSILVIYRDPTLSVDLDGLAVDTTTQKLYFSDAGSDAKIVEIDLLDQDRTQRIIIKGRSLKPKAIVVDEANSELYWTDWSSKPGIFAKGLEPNAQLRTLIADNVVTPNALAIDFKEEVMYWADSVLDRIERANLDGQERRLLVKESGDVHYYAMTISAQFLYIADWTKSTVFRVDRLTNTTSNQMPILAGRKSGVAYYNSNFTNVGNSRSTRRTVVPLRTTLSTASGKAEATFSTVNGKAEATFSTVNGKAEATFSTVNGKAEAAFSTVNGKAEAAFSTAKGKAEATFSKADGKAEATFWKDNVKAEAERLVNENGSKTVIALAITGCLFLLLLIIALAIWITLRRRRRSVEITAVVGFSPAVAYEDGHSGRGRLLIEDAYAVKANSYEHLPEVMMPPCPPPRRPEPTACGSDDDWYMKMADVSCDPVKNTGYCVKPTENDFYDDIK